VLFLLIPPDQYQDVAWLTQHGVPSSAHLGVIKLLGSGARLQSALRSNPYAPIEEVRSYKLKHAEAVAAALNFSPAADERAAAVLLHELLAECKKRSECGLQWIQLEGFAYAKLDELGELYSRPWPAGKSLRPAAELLTVKGKMIAEEVLLLPGQQGSSSSSSSSRAEAMTAVVAAAAAAAAAVRVQVRLAWLVRCRIRDAKVSASSRDRLCRVCGRRSCRLLDSHASPSAAVGR
jgi:hypothetical protein